MTKWYDRGAQLEISPTSNGWRLSGELDAHTAPSLASAMAVLPAVRIIVDLANVTFVDSSGLRVLLDATNRARAAGGDMTLSGPQQSIRRLIEISGIRDHIHVQG